MTIELKQARELLKKAVETQGEDFVYNLEVGSLCYYEPRPDLGGPKAVTGCLVGTALTLAGETRHLGVKGSVLGLLYQFPDMLTGDAAHYFQKAQDHQDGSGSWGGALQEAEDSLSH